jgi:hypothetical protein
MMAALARKPKLDSNAADQALTRCKVIMLVALCALVTLNAGCGGLPPSDGVEPGGAVVVIVVDADTSAPLQVPATVIAGGVRGLLQPSDEQLVLRNVPVGSGTPPTQPLTVTAEGYVTSVQQVQMAVTAATWVTVELTPADLATTGTIGGIVVDEVTGGPITSAFVEFAPPTGDGARVGGFSDNTGEFIIGGVPAGDRMFTAQAAGYLPDAGTVRIVADAAGQNADLQIELVAGDTTIDVPGTVVDVFTQGPIEGAEVSIGGSTPAVTGPDGRFVAPDVPVGDQEVLVSAEGYENYHQTLQILPGIGEITIEIFERADDPPGDPFTVTGTVTLSGAPDNAGATVTATRLDSGTVLDRDTTDASGHYALFVPPGQYQITVEFEGRNISRELAVPPGGVIGEDVNFMLTVQ